MEETMIFDAMARLYDIHLRAQTILTPIVDRNKLTFLASENPAPIAMAQNPTAPTISSHTFLVD